MFIDLPRAGGHITVLARARRTALTLTALGAVLSAAVAPVSPLAPRTAAATSLTITHDQPSLDELRAGILEDLNAFRASSGLPALALSDSMTAEAQARLEACADPCLYFRAFEGRLHLPFTPQTYYPRAAFRDHARGFGGQPHLTPGLTQAGIAVTEKNFVYSIVVDLGPTPSTRTPAVQTTP